MNPTPENPRLQEALLQAQHGHRVHPCHYPTADGCSCRKCDESQQGKHPLLTGWLKLATTDESIIRKWWAEDPDRNIGIATGPGSDLLVVDIDIRNGKRGFEDLQDLDPTGRGVEGFETPSVRTGSGGRQLYFRWPPGCKLTTDSGIGGKALDYRGIGGNAIGPGSRNDLGAYEWILSLEDCPKEQCPDWLLAFLSSGKAPAGPSGNGHAGSLLFALEHDLGTHPGASAGERNGLLCKLVGAALASGQAPDEVMQQAIAWNRRCAPPKAEAGIRKSVQAIITKEWQSLRERASAPAAGIAAPTLRLPVKKRLQLVTRLSADVEEEQLVWLWWNRFLIGHVNILAGDPGLGKSLLAVDAAARVSTGRSWPDGTPCQKGRVVYATTEDAFASVVKPRLTAADADHNQVTFVEGVSDDHGEGSLFLDEHMALLDDLMAAQEGQVRLLVLDTLQSFVGSETNTSNNASSRRIMTPLKRLAEKHKVAVLCLEHLTKGTTQRNATYRVQGSIAFTGAARSVWIVVKDQQDPSRRIVQAGKCNLSPDGEGLGLAYTIAGEVGRPYIVWGETDIRTPLTELMDENQDSGSGGDDARTEFASAVQWLRENLTEPTKAAVMEEGFRMEGFSKTTMKRAKAHLLVTSQRTAEGWLWMPSPQVSIGSEVIADPMKE